MSSSSSSPDQAPSDQAPSDQAPSLHHGPSATSSSPLSIPEALTVIIVTSPTPSAPSTSLLDSILASFHEHCSGLLTCRVVTVLDTYDRIGPQNRLKRGSVTVDGAHHYQAYKDKVKTLLLRHFVPDMDATAPAILLEGEGTAEFGSAGMPSTNHTRLRIQRTEDRRVTFIEPSDRLGFGLAVRSALRLVETAYVWVQQHDWLLVASIPIDLILQVMMLSESNKDQVPVRYVCLPSPRMRAYAGSAHVNRFPALRELTRTHKRDFAAGSGTPSKLPLTPLFFWHDKPHVASTEHYHGRIFPSRLAIPRGAFIEDHVGQRARNQMKQGLFAKWACWLYYPEGGRLQCLKHLHGRTWRGTEAESERAKARRMQGRGAGAGAGAGADASASS